MQPSAIGFQPSARMMPPHEKIAWLRAELHKCYWPFTQAHLDACHARAEALVFEYRRIVRAQRYN